MSYRAVIAYLEARRGDEQQAAQLDVKEAEIVMEDMIKQAGKGSAAPQAPIISQPLSVQRDEEMK